MDIQKVKELALANGFKLKEQASGNMDLNSYVYDFANAIEQAAKAQAVPGWINVNLLSPQIDTEVLVCIDDDVKTAIYRDLDGEGYFEGIFGAKWWMPKPKAQEQANESE